MGNSAEIDQKAVLERGFAFDRSVATHRESCVDMLLVHSDCCQQDLVEHGQNLIIDTHSDSRKVEVSWRFTVL